jgi:hypothetical protein
LVEKTAKQAPPTFNARAKTDAEKPTFRSAFQRPPLADTVEKLGGSAIQIPSVAFLME